MTQNTMATFRVFAFIVLILSGVLAVKVAKLIPSVLGHPALGWITIPALTFPAVFCVSRAILWIERKIQ
jgi:hypothetical protein